VLQELVTLDVTPSRARLNEVKVRFTPVNIAQMIGGSTTSIIGSIYVQEHKQGTKTMLFAQVYISTALTLS